MVGIIVGLLDLYLDDKNVLCVGGINWEILYWGNIEIFNFYFWELLYCKEICIIFYI